MASEIISVVTCIAQYTVGPVVKQVQYVFNYHQNLANLPIEVQKLMDLKKEIEGLVSSAQRNAEAIKPSVEAWMEKADQVAEAANQVTRKEEEESKKRCLIGMCPNPVSRHRSSRKAFKETVQILQLQADGREFKEGSVSFPVSIGSSFRGTSDFSEVFLDFKSRSESREDIVKALKDSGANVIGVCGMGGIGKTTLVKQVAARAAEEKLFDEVIMPIVTQKNVPDVKEYQDEMAKELGLRLESEWSVSQRAARIYERLSQKTNEKAEKKTLVVLDDLRGVLDLKQVGIPFGVGIKGCKVLFTSRFQYVSYAPQKTITLGVLKDEEAWRLFQKIVGDVTKDRDFFNTGEQVTKKCKGLPILIVTVAAALLRRKSLGAWKDALINLQREGSKEMQEFVDSALEFISFNHLPDANKSLFLLCGLLGGGEIAIFDQLLKLGIGWGLFIHTKTVEEARNNLDTLIHDLKASFLLLDGQTVDYVRMHDVVRDVAIKIASNEGHNTLLGSSDNWPDDCVLRRCITLTSPYGIVPELPECFDSPSLKFLLLYHNHSTLKITDNLFEKMQKLIVLDIRSVDIFPKLPSSISLLVNLQTLSLNLCKLRDISIVGALKKLKILSLNSTGIVALPIEIGDLSDLRVLDVNGCSELKVIPPGVIQRLYRLEELHMANSFSEWEVEGLASIERRNASLVELNYLVNLTTLRIHIPDAKLLPEDFDFEKLKRFTILIGDERWYWRCHEYDEQSLYRFRGIKIKVDGSRNIHLEAGVQEILKRTEILYLDGMENIHELEWKFLQELKFVHIQHSAKTRYIVNAMESFPAGPESLFLSHLPQLQILCRGMFMAESFFSKLKYVDVNNCRSLRNLFSFFMARGVPHLEEVKVTDCDSFEAILEDGKNGDTVMDKLEFRQLRSLILERLPKLASFCNTDKVLFPKLEELSVYECDNMEYLFNQSDVMGLEQLNSITIYDCKSLKEIVARVDGVEPNEMIKFPQLVKLSLEKLHCLVSFCFGCSIVFPALTVLGLTQCRRLKTIVWEDKTMTNTTMQPLFNDKVELPNLKELYISSVGNVNAIWHNRLHEDSFFKLEEVHIGHCRRLLKIFSSAMLGRIQSLEKLELLDNRFVEEVFENDEMTKPNISQGRETTEDKIEFPRLRCLDLWRMSDLKRFCSGSRVVFPALTQLHIRDCGQIETFMYPIGVSNSARNGVEDMDSTDMQPLFNKKVEFHSLKELKFGPLNNIKTIWHSRILEDSFSTLEELSIWRCANLSIILPLAVLERIPSLKKLCIERCPGLATIVQGSVSFKFLTELEVSECDGLVNLVQFSTAKSLVQLTTLKVTRCRTMKEIVGRESADGAEDEIVFSKLKILELVQLPSLVNFYLGNCILKFPSLEEVEVVWCENMKAFSGGITVAPKLKAFSVITGSEKVTNEEQRLALSLNLETRKNDGI